MVRLNVRRVEGPWWLHADNSIAFVAPATSHGPLSRPCICRHPKELSSGQRIEHDARAKLDITHIVLLKGRQDNLCVELMQREER
jgi:hypothetical protein